jgi:hypothetical protein
MPKNQEDDEGACEHHILYGCSICTPLSDWEYEVDKFIDDTETLEKSYERDRE